MPTSLLSETELQLFLTAVISSHSVAELDKLLEASHEFNTFGSLGPHERYFKKILGYRDFNIHIPYVLHDNTTLSAIRIQFKRPSKFPAPYLNRNKNLIKELNALLRPLLGNAQFDNYNEEERLHYYYYGPGYRIDLPNGCFTTGREYTLIDEPYSSGQTDPSHTNIRNDFVIFKYESKDLKEMSEYDGV